MKKISEIELIKNQIDECLEYMKILAGGFNETSDKQLTGYYIYERRAAEARYVYLLGVYNELMEKGGA